MAASSLIRKYVSVKRMRGCPQIKHPITIGQRFGRLTTEGQVFYRQGPKQVERVVACRCDCGTVVVRSVRRLASTKRNSCGCWHNERVAQMGADNATHGMTGTLLHGVWLGMRQRCANKNNPAYPDYGGRGIEVCDEWNTSFVAFADWALANGYDESLSIDRIDNDGNYEPGNCRWADRKVQGNNKRNNNVIAALGETKTLAEWSADARCVVSAATFKCRVTEHGWDIVSALTTPLRGRFYSAFGESKTLRRWSADSRCMVTYSTLRVRVWKGWDFCRALESPSRRNGG